MRYPRPVWAGMAMATPFIADFFPWRYAALVTAPFLFHLFFFGFRLQKPNYFPLFIWLLGGVVIIHGIALVMSPTPFMFSVVKDIVITVWLVACFFFGMETHPTKGEMSVGLFFCIIPFSIISSLLGIIKFALQERGLLIESILNQCSGNYPAGTSFCVDYNLLAMMYLVAAMGLVAITPKNRLVSWQSISLVLVLAAGLLTGSRRFLILVPMVPIHWIVSAYIVYGRKVSLIRSILVMVALSCFIFLTVHGVSDPIRSERYMAGVEKYKVVNVSTLIALLYKKEETAALLTSNFSGPSPNRAYPDVMLGTLKNEAEYGNGSRIDRWKLAFDLIVDGAWLVPIGFKYHELFSCKFVRCTFLDYPHMPLMSAALIGGLGYVALLLAIYSLLFYAIWCYGRRGWLSGISPVVLVVMPFSMISGDTLLSFPHLVAVGLVLYAGLNYGSHAAKGT